MRWKTRAAYSAAGEAVSTEVTEDKKKSNASELVKRPHLALDELLPNPVEWQQKWHTRNHKRFQLLRFLWFTLAAANLTHFIVLLISLGYRLYLNSWIKSHTLPVITKTPSSDSPYYVTNCAAIYPEYTGQQDWYLLDFLPYASLPRKQAAFAMSVRISTFQECYNAFWLGVHPSKRQFVNGQLRFLGKRADMSCLQLGRGGLGESATVANCLTVSFHFRLRNLNQFSGVGSRTPSTHLKPTIAYIGGQGLLYHRPQLIPLNLENELGVLYIVIRYRLGVFGFGDFDTVDYGPNHGVEDVRNALQWIYENAEMFCGSPKNLTLIGEGSGVSIALAVSRDRYAPSDGKTNST